MNCPTCKNPIKDNSIECEWCGIEIKKSNSVDIDINQNRKIKIDIKSAGPLYKKTVLDIFLNDDLKCKGIMSERYNFEIDNTISLPKVKFKANLYNKKIEIPRLDLHKNYLIEIEFSNWTGHKIKTIKEIE